MTDPTALEDAYALGELIRNNDRAADATGDRSAIAAAKSLHIAAFEMAQRHAELIGLDLNNQDQMTTLSGGTPKGPPPPGG